VSSLPPELIARCQRGDTAAFAQVVAETQSGVYNLAFSVLHNHEEAQDITQEIYMRVWRALPSFRGESKFSTWLYRIAVNTCLNRRRQLRGQLRIVDPNEDVLERLVATDDDPAASTMVSERNQVLWSAVDRLPEKYRLIITLFYQQQLSYPEIAALLALPLGTVKAHLNRARAALAKSLRPNQENHHAVL
jgi:RNA polymerase sigma-70 factor, ECF subfamily